MTKFQNRDVMKKRQAVALGLRRYFTGKPCKYGHFSERYIWGACIECTRIKDYKKYKRHWNIAKDITVFYDGCLISREKAKSLGLTKFFTGKPCVHGHIAQRYVCDGNLCFRCSQIYSHLQNVKNKNKKKVHKTAKPVKPRIYKLSEKRRLIKRISKQNREARKRGNGGRHKVAEIRALIIKQNNKCINCLISFKKTGYNVDHIIALVNGGRNDISNIQLLCPDCNVRKGAKNPLAFAREEGRLL